MATVSYDIRIKDRHHIMDGTVKYYRDAVNYIAEVCLAHYPAIDAIKGDFSSAKRMSRIENLIHSTEDNIASYKEFDQRFYKFPSYLRRAAIMEAYGLVDSYRKLVSLWEENGKQGKRPRFTRGQACMPCFYRGNTFKEFPEDHLFYLKDEDSYMIKVWHMHDWVWIPIVLRETDLRYVKEHCIEMKECAPVLVKKYRKYYLRFAYKETKEIINSRPKYLKDKDVTRVLGVDLGVNTDAVCSVVNKDGTVTGRKFINHPVEKDRLYTILNKIRKVQNKGNNSPHRLWRFVDNLNTSVSIDTARRIVRYAEKEGVEVIVMEHLSITGKIKGSKAQKITLWRKCEIQHRVEELAARSGIRVTYIFASRTSKYAFDGSGLVERDKNNYSMCTFATGKRYNCDLSASYNIGARFFIRVLLKTMPAKVRLQAEAKVPSARTRTTCTLSTLISLCTVLMGLPVNTETDRTGRRAVPTV